MKVPNAGNIRNLFGKVSGERHHTCNTAIRCDIVQVIPIIWRSGDGGCKVRDLISMPDRKVMNRSLLNVTVSKAHYWPRLCDLRFCEGN